MVSGTTVGVRRYVLRDNRLASAQLLVAELGAYRHARGASAEARDSPERALRRRPGNDQLHQWDRAAYVERVGGEDEAERRRKALMARQSGYRLAEERKRHGLTQAQLAETMGVTPGRVSHIERGEVSTIEAIARYVQALGGRLDLVANFDDHTLTVTTTEAA